MNPGRLRELLAARSRADAAFWAHMAVWERAGKRGLCDVSDKEARELAEVGNRLARERGRAHRGLMAGLKHAR